MIPGSHCDGTAFTDAADTPAAKVHEQRGPPARCSSETPDSTGGGNS